MATPSLTSEQVDTLTTLAENANAQLEATAANSAGQAFNVGCSVGLVPGLLLVILVFFLSKGSIAATAIAFLLVTLVLVLFANIIAYTSRSRVIDRFYHEQIELEIKNMLDEIDLSLRDFSQVASLALPKDAALQKYLITPHKPGME
jgi:hypothetical protein